MKHSLRLALLLLASSLASCASTATSYVEGLSGYAVTKGRITRVENFSARIAQTLGDGLALKVTQPCKVSITFQDEQTKLMDIEPGMLIVYGYADDYVLKSLFESTLPEPQADGTKPAARPDQEPAPKPDAAK